MIYHGKVDEDDPRVHEALQALNARAREFLESVANFVANAPLPDAARSSNELSMALKIIAQEHFRRTGGDVAALISGTSIALGGILANSLQQEGIDEALRYVAQGAQEVAHGEAAINAGRAGLKH